MSEQKYVVLVGASSIIALAAWLLAQRKAGASVDTPLVVNNDSATLEEVTVTASRLAMLTPTDPSAPPGIRNNNPGNLRYLALSPYLGQTGRSGNFGVYSSANFGIRALALELYNDYTRKGYTSVAQLITEWAPESDGNDTQAYIRAVANAMGVAPTQPFDYKTRITAMVKAIIKQENGVQPYSDAVINQAIIDTGKV